MIFRKIKYQLKKFSNFLSRRFGNFEINWGYWFFTFLSFIGIILLGLNIFRVVRKGYERYEILLEEKKRLEELYRRNAELKEDLKYYSSKEYVDLKAREELNLTFPDQKLIYIEKEVDIDIKEDKNEQEALEPSWEHWYDLIFE